MFRRTAILGLSLALGAFAPLVLAVDAEATATAAVAPATAVPGTPAAAPAEGRKAAVPPKFARTDCSGTRIRASAGKPCSPSSTLLRSWSQDDLQRTGQMQIGDALRLLDPMFR